jgi:hypothetical protein
VRAILLIDALLDFALGIPLAVHPLGVIRLLGLPPAIQPFYPSVLGAVLIGVGIALLIQRSSETAGGLGVAGAASINLCGAVALAAWLWAGPLETAAWTRAALWILTVVLGALSAVELAMLAWSRRARR